MLSHSQNPLTQQTFFQKRHILKAAKKKNRKENETKKLKFERLLQKFIREMIFLLNSARFALFFSARMRFYQLNDLCNDFLGTCVTQCVDAAETEITREIRV